MLILTLYKPYSSNIDVTIPNDEKLNITVLKIMEARKRKFIRLLILRNDQLNA